MASTIRSDRDKPDVTRTWNRREEKVAKRLTHQRCYIEKCVNRLKARVKTNADFIFQLRKYLFRNITELLHTADECLVSGGDGGGAEAGEHPTGTTHSPRRPVPRSAVGCSHKRWRSRRCWKNIAIGICSS